MKNCNKIFYLFFPAVLSIIFFCLCLCLFLQQHSIFFFIVLFIGKHGSKKLCGKQTSRSKKNRSMGSSFPLTRNTKQQTLKQLYVVIAKNIYRIFDLLFSIQFVLIKRIKRKWRVCFKRTTNRLLKQTKKLRERNISDRLCVRAWIVIIFCMIYCIFISCMTFISVSHLKQANS